MPQWTETLITPYSRRTWASAGCCCVLLRNVVDEHLIKSWENGSNKDLCTDSKECAWEDSLMEWKLSRVPVYSNSSEAIFFDFSCLDLAGKQLIKSFIGFF